MMDVFERAIKRLEERDREIAKLKQIVAAYKENSDEANGDFKKGRSAIVDLVRSYEDEIAKLRRGEYICRKCGLRKDGEFEPGDF